MRRYFYILCLIPTIIGVSNDLLAQSNMDLSYRIKENRDFSISEIGFHDLKMNDNRSKADYFFELEKFDSAIFYYKIIEEQYERDAFYFFLRGYTEMQMLKYENAIQSFNKSLSFAEPYPSSYLDRSWKIAPKSINIYDAFEIELAPIKIDVSGNNSIRTRRDFTKSLKYCKADNYLFIGFCKLLINDYNGAVRELKKYHQITRDSCMLSNCFIGISLQQLGKYPESIKYLSRASTYYKGFGRYNDDIEFYQIIYIHRGLSYKELGNNEMACWDFNVSKYLGNRLADKYIILNNCNVNK
ncbi:MAG: hypothetical protein WCO54_06890 [Bacteroidota bacterium]